MFKWPGAPMTYLHLRQHLSVHGARAYVYVHVWVNEPLDRIFF